MSEIKVSLQACAEAIPLKYVVIVLRDGDQVLWARHRRRSAWEIPGGHLEPGETPRQAAERELWEETGVTQAELLSLIHISRIRNIKWEDDFND